MPFRFNHFDDPLERLTQVVRDTIDQVGGDNVRELVTELSLGLNRAPGPIPEQPEIPQPDPFLFNMHASERALPRGGDDLDEGAPSGGDAGRLAANLFTKAGRGGADTTFQSAIAPVGNTAPVAQDDDVDGLWHLDTLSEAAALLESLGESGGATQIDYYGQTFVAQGDLTQISLAIDPRDSNGDQTFEFRILVTEIADGEIRPASILFESPELVLSGPEREVVTIDTGGLELVPGATYAILIDAYSGFDGVLGNAGVVAADQGDPDGQFFFHDVSQGGTRSEHFAGEWQVFANNSLDMALDLTFTDAATTEDAPLVIAVSDLLANDGDADGDALQITEVSATSALGARVLLHADGTITYDPGHSPTLDALVDGETLQDSFTYTVSDGNGGVATATVTLTVAGVDDAPVQVLDLVPQAQFHDQAFSYQIPTGLFSDQDGGSTLTYTVTLADGAPLPDFLTFDAQTGTLSFAPGAPTAMDIGLLVLRVTATEPGGQSSSALLPLTVLAGTTVNGTEDGERLLGATTSGDLIEGLGGNDTIYGQNNGDNVLRGGDGNDTLSGRNRDDVVEGGAGNDRIIDGGGNDVVYGGLGDDRLEAYAGTDTLFGGAGDDLLIAAFNPGYAGLHQIDGGDGFDTAWLDMRHATPGAWQVDDTGAYGPDGQVFGSLTDIESITAVFTTGNDTVTGEFLEGYYNGQGGEDLLILDFSQRFDGLDVSAVDLTLGSSARHDVTLQDGSVSHLRVWEFEEFDVTGSAGNDVIRITNGQAGENTVVGGAGDDLISTSLGNEVLDGGAGNDTITGAAGNDTMTGGAGADVFVFYTGTGQDVITDFDPAADRLALYAGQEVSSLTQVDTDDVAGADSTLVELTDWSTILLQSLAGITDPDDLL